ncbi:glycosyltransferase family A protein [Okibacterium endophyticum]
MHEPLRISVVIPVRDDARMLESCLDALAAQTRRADEVVVVDNDSSDDSATIAQRGGARVVTEPVHGILAATATGFDSATGDLFARIDADSVPPPDWLERVEKHFIAQPGIAALTGPGDFYGGNAVVRRIARIAYIGGYFWSMGLVLGHPPLFGSNMTITADAWARIRTSVHRRRREVHDDLDISFALQPDMRVVYDRDLAVGISARPFDSFAGFARRIAWAATTIALGVRTHPPVARRRQRRRAQAQDAQPGSA